MELLGFTLNNLFDLLEEAPESKLLAKDLSKHLGHTVTISGEIVHVKNTNTSSGNRMQFGCFYDADGEFFDTTHFPPVAAQYPFKGKGVYEITGEVTDEFGFCSIEVSSMKRLPFIPDPRYNDG